jgi:PAS domain S-box-containing protein
MDKTSVKDSMVSMQWARWSVHVAMAFGVLVVLGGAVHLVAWFSGYMVNRGFSTVTMKTNTALALLFEGLGLLLLASPRAEFARRWAGRSLATFAALIGLLSLGENLLGWNLGIDQMLAREAPGAMAVGAPNLMGTPAATSFLLAGLALLILSRRDGRGAKAGHGLALAVCLIALLGIIGYLYGAQDFYAIARLTGIAWPTALALLVLGLGLLLARPTEGLMAQITADDSGGANLRRWLPMLLLPIGLGSLQLVGERLRLFDAATGTAMLVIIFIGALAVLAYMGARQVSRSAAALQHQREWLRVTLSSIGDAVIATDTVCKITFLNPAAEELTGWKEQEVLGRPVHEVFQIIDEQTRQPAAEIVQLVLLEGRVVALANHTALVTKNGRQIPIEDSAAPIKDRDGSVSGVVLVFHDVTEKRRAHRAVVESEERYRNLFGSMAEAFALHEIVTDEQGHACDYRFLEVNNSFERMTGLKRSDIVNRNVRDVLPGIETYWIETYGKVALTGEPVNFEKYYPAPLNRWYEVFAYRPRPRQFAAVFLDVTQRKQAVEALRNSEATLHLAERASRAGSWDWDIVAGKIGWDPELCNLFGVDPTRQTPSFELWRRIVHADDEPDASERIDTALREHSTLASEYRVILPDGAIRWIYSSGEGIYNEKDSPIRMIGICIDITERKLAEEDIRKAKDELELRVQERTAELTEALQTLRRTGAYTRSLIEASLDPLVTIGRDGRIADVNAAAETVTGRVRQELVGTDFSIYFTEPEKAREGYQRVFEEGSIRDYALEIRHRDGHTIPVLYNAAVYRDETGRVIGIIAAARDITARKLAEAALRQSEQEFRSLAEAVPQIVWATRPDGWNIYFNQKWVDYTGLTLDESYGHGWNIPFHPDDQERAWDAWKHATQDEAPYSLECRLRRADGIYRWWLIRGEPMKGANGEILKWFGTCTDIEELKQASEQLRRIASELMVAEQRERQRLAQVLHDGLQQILVGAKYRLALLERGKDIQQTTGQIAELIDDAIETSRSLSAELSPPILLQGDFVAALEWLARWMHDKHGIEVNLIARAKIAHLEEDAILLLFQAARELLFNVVKHAGVKNAYIELNQLDGHVSLAVEDKGVGFDQNKLALRGGQSSGTGLFGISERLSYIGGRIEIQSAPGRGSRFRVMVPISEANTEADQGANDKMAQISVAISAQPHSKPAGVEKKIRIALVDDHMVVRQGLAGLLRAEPDIEIIGEASDGQSAVSLARELRPNVMLMDISLPGMDGIQATQIIHKELPEVCVIGLSMFMEGEQQAAMREAGAVNYLTKTGPSEALIDAIRACARVSERSIAETCEADRSE